MPAGRTASPARPAGRRDSHSAISAIRRAVKINPGGYLVIGWAYNGQPGVLQARCVGGGRRKFSTAQAPRFQPQRGTKGTEAARGINIQHSTCFVERIVRPRRQPFPRPASGARGEGQGEGIFKERLLSPALSSVSDGGEGDQTPVFSRIQDLFYKARSTLNQLTTTDYADEIRLPQRGTKGTEQKNKT